MARSTGNLFKILAVILIIIAGIALFFFLTLQNRIPEMLQREFGLSVAIADTHVSLSGPKLVLSDVRVHQPVGYGPGDALVIERVVVSFDGFGRNPVVINSIGAEGIKGNAVYTNSVDSFSALQQQIEARYTPATDGFWARPSIIEAVQVRNSSLTSNGITVALPDRNSNPIGTTANMPPLKQAVAIALIKILESQRMGLNPLAAEELKNTTTRVIQKLGEKFREFMEKPAGFEFFDPPANMQPPAPAVAPPSTVAPAVPQQTP